jgi:hypothetical protein
MATSLRPNPFCDALADEHRSWLSTFDARYLANWEKILNANEESTLAEAGVRRLLEGHGVRVEPNEDMTGAEQRPDFRCEMNGSSFEVEVTHISIEKATRVTGLAKVPTVNLGAEAPPTFEDFPPIHPLTGAVFSACVRKAKQCAVARNPTLLAVATFHYPATVFCFDKCDISQLLTGVTSMRLSLDKQPGQAVGEAYLITELQSAVFLRPDSSEPVGFARSSISALLLCGLCTQPPQVIGVLHPNPARPFNPAILPQVEFGQVAIDRASRQLHVAWPQG